MQFGKLEPVERSDFGCSVQPRTPFERAETEFFSKPKKISTRNLMRFEDV